MNNVTENKPQIKLNAENWSAYSYYITVLLAGKQLLHTIEPSDVKASDAQKALALSIIVSTLDATTICLCEEARDPAVAWANIKRSQTKVKSQQAVHCLQAITSSAQSHEQSIKDYSNPLVESLRELNALCRDKTVPQVLELIACTSFLKGIDNRYDAFAAVAIPSDDSKKLNLRDLVASALTEEARQTARLSNAQNNSIATGSAATYNQATKLKPNKNSNDRHREPRRDQHKDRSSIICTFCNTTGSHTTEKCFIKARDEMEKLVQIHSKNMQSNQSRANVVTSAGDIPGPVFNGKKVVPNNTLSFASVAERSAAIENAKLAHASLAIQHSHNAEDGWIIDSGADTHMCHDRSMFKCLKPTNTTGVAFADGSISPVGLSGDIEALILTSNGSFTVRLHDVLYVPTLSRNLISAMQWAREGIYMTTTEEGCLLSQKDVVLARVVSSGNLLPLTVQRINTTNMVRGNQISASQL
jgi:hypothetical protein